MEKKAIILGSTGAVGKHLLAELLSSPYYSSVHAVVRRPYKSESVHKDDSRLVEHIVDFEKLSQANGETATASVHPQVQFLKSIGAEAVYITLGTTRRQAGSAANFVKIDRHYVLAGAKAAQSEESGASQRVIYCSSGGANKQSVLPYLQSKGLTEEGLASLGYSDCILFRPGYLSGARREGTTLAERIFGSAMTGIGGRISSKIDIQVADVGKAMAVAGIKGSAGLGDLGVGSPPSDSFNRPKDSKVTIIDNMEAKHLAKLPVS